MSGFSITKTVLHHLEEERLLVSFFEPLDHNGIFVDIGGNLPENAVSKPFLKAGWTGLLFEPIPKNAEQFKTAQWPNVINKAVTSPSKAANETATFFLAGGDTGPHSSLEASGIDPNSLSDHTMTVSLTTLQAELDHYAISHIDLLSIDTEGTEYDVLSGIDFSKVTIRLILTEDWQRDSKVHRLLTKNGFKIIMRTGFNSWYVPSKMPVNVPLFGRINLLKKIYISSHIKKLRHRFNVLVHKRRSVK